jgi:2-C-methyl-D-erythritol 4-phosphate cytidylyltransferase
MTHTPPTTSALIPAAGSGTRLGMGFKALVQLGGISLLERAIQNMSGQVDQIWIAIAPQMEPALEPLLLRYPNLHWVWGGETRQDSVSNLLEASQSDVVLVHDAARPFLAMDRIAALLAAVHQTEAATLALACADTLVQTQNGYWQTLIDRSRASAVQTPQGFRRALLLQAHQQARKNQTTATDDAGLVVQLGHPVQIVAGDSRLFKITTPNDLELAQAFVGIWDATRT